MTDPKAALVWCPFPDCETARAIAKSLLDEDLIACANLLGEVESIFNWEGKVETGSETGVLLKTRSDLLERAIERLGELHPYDTPAILGWHCDQGHPGTLEWLGALGAN
ncbi:MAG: divalent-cation tolerance protein CutA [Pseudomonadota bacterium]